MFRRKVINGSFECMGVPDFLRTDGPSWTATLLDTYVDWGSGGTSTSQNLSYKRARTDQSFTLLQGKCEI